MKARTNISLKERRTLTLGNFKGVDFSSSPLNVRGDRASNMRNFINEYGVNKKRNGWNELLKIKHGGEVQRINGIFEYVNRDRREILVHAGKRFYQITSTDGKYSYSDITFSSTYLPAKCNVNLLKDQRSQAFFNKERMYIIGCGDYLVYGSWDGGTTYELRRVANNEDTYIPTTTVSIDSDDVDDSARASLDDINYLSTKRINKLVGSSDTNKTWTLDGSIDENTEVEIKVETLTDKDNRKEYYIKNYLEEDGVEPENLYVYMSKEDGESPGINEMPSLSAPCGNINWKEGKITLDISTKLQVENRDNIYVTFECSSDNRFKRITDCNFGIFFGVEGNFDRLFLSGNQNFPNIEFYSEQDDYTYFGDKNTAAFGSDLSAINGFLRLSDNTLAVFKEKNRQDPTVFYQTGRWKTYYTDSGEFDKFIAEFPITIGGIGESIISRFASVNFSGDNVILSENGVFGIMLTENVATTERYTSERSRSINEKLTRHRDLSDAVGVVYKNRYYLAIDGVCYVADSRYKYSAADSVDGSYNYEWWFWDNIPARVWANIGDKLYFGSEAGQICVFDDKYTDRTYFKFGVGELSLNSSEDNLFDFSENIELSENDRITYSTEGVYALALYNFTVEDGKIKTDGNEIFSFRDGMKVYADKVYADNVYADNVYDSGLSVDTEYTVKDIDFGSCTFKLKNENNEDVTPKCGGFRLCYSISNTELYITNITSSTFQIKRYNAPISDDNPVITLTAYNDRIPVSLLASITHYKNVVSEWYTPILDLGTNESSKTLLKMTISTEPEVNGKLSFGYETRNVNRLIAAKGINVFSFDNFSFANFSFDTGFANSYSVRCNERNFNFIIFRFISDNDANCAVNTFTINYKINKHNRGVN